MNNVWFRSYPTRRRTIRAEPWGTVTMASRFDSSVWRRARALLRIAASSRSAAWVAGLASFDGIAGACAPTATPRSDGVACGGWSPAKVSSSNLWTSLLFFCPVRLEQCPSQGGLQSSYCYAQKSIRPKSSCESANGCDTTKSSFCVIRERTKGWWWSSLKSD